MTDDYLTLQIAVTGERFLIRPLVALKPSTFLLDRLPQPIELQGMPPGVYLVGDVQIDLDPRRQPAGPALLFGQPSSKSLHNGAMVG